LSFARSVISVESDAMAKPYLDQNRRIFVLIIVCAALACLAPGGVLAADKTSPASKQQQTQQAGRLIIVRSARMGSIVVGVSIDGKETAKINFGGSYDAPLAAGPHVITVVPLGNREHAQPGQTRVTVQPGQTYKFTAVQSDVSIVLK
jgi:hypothetical protein